MTCELAEVLNEFIDKYDTDVGRNDWGRKKEDGEVGKLSGREYVCLRSGQDLRSLYKILKNQTLATDFDKADVILCSIELQGEFHDRIEVHYGELRWVGQDGSKPRARSAPAYTRMTQERM